MPNVSNIQYNGTTYGIEGVTDATLTISGRAADAAAVGAALARGSGLTEEAKQALLACFAQVAWIGDDGLDYYNALVDALYPPANLTGISAVYTQSVTVYNTDSLDSLRSGLVVTATYSDSSTSVVTTYTLSGTLAEGTSTITVSYGGKTDTFDVTVTHNVLPVYSWDFTSSLTDSIAGMTAVTKGGASRDSSGVSFTGSGQCVVLTDSKVTISNRTVIIDIPSGNLSIASGTHARLFASSANSNGNAATSSACFVYHYSNGWNVYSGSAWGTAISTSTYPATFFNNKRVKLYIGSDMKVKVSYAAIDSDSFTTIGTFATAWESTYSSGYLVLASYNTNNTSPMTISKVKIYEGEV